jgi:hypothetical protein
MSVSNSSKVWYNQLLASRGVSEANFSNGSMYFDDQNRGGISHSDYSGSYCRIRTTAYVVGAGPGFVTRKLVLADGVALNMNTPATLFQGISCDVGGTTIEDVTNFVAEIDTYSVRTSTSKALMDSVLATTCFFQPEISQRMQYTASDGKQTFFNNAGLIIRDSTNTVLTAGSLPDPEFIAEYFEFIWTPQCLGINKFSGLVPPSIPVRFTFTPYNASSLAMRALESVGPITIGKPLTTAGVYFAVIDFQMYIRKIDLGHYSEGEFLIPLNCINVQPTNLQNTTSNNNTYTIPETTNLISLAYADSRRGSDSRYSATKFRVNQAVTPTGTTSSELNITRWSIKYGSAQLPVQSPEPSFNSVASFITQAYVEHLMSNGLMQKEGGAENLSDYIERGAVYSYEFPENGTRSTNCNVQSYFNGNYANTTELLFYSYTKLVRVSVSNERVVSVTVN